MGKQARGVGKQVGVVEGQVGKRNLEEKIELVEEEIRKLEEKIERVEEEIRELEKKIERLEEQVETCSKFKEKAQLRDEKAQLRNEKAQLQNEKGQLRDEKARLQGRDGGQTSKRPRLLEEIFFRSFVQSAEKNYRQWEDAYKVVEEAGVVKEVHKNFLVVSGDPLGNYEDGFLLWVRNCYKDVKEILVKAKASERFTLLGTAGVGKSVFSIFWVCYLATLKKKLVWKFSNGECYVLDFGEGASSSEIGMVDGPFAKTDFELTVVYNDPTAWLIVDGRQGCGLRHRCHILLACSARKDNYKEFCKNRKVRKLYMPVWTKEEIVEFLDDFEVTRGNYSWMNVPDRDDALGYFEMLGGVPRYVLDAERTGDRLEELKIVVNYFNKDTCLKFFTGEFEEERMSDCIVHMYCLDGEYDRYFYDLASPYVKEEFGNRFNKLSKAEVVDFLMANADNTFVGSTYGYIFELVAHAVMQRGGIFTMKKVASRGERCDTESKEQTLTLSNDMKVVIFRDGEEISSMPNTHYKPSISNFESVDAIVSPGKFLQFFNSHRGQHGYKVSGLKRLHEQLKLTKYNLYACVPKEKYKSTGYQHFLASNNTVYQADDKVLNLMERYVVKVDYTEYRSLS